MFNEDIHKILYVDIDMYMRVEYSHRNRKSKMYTYDVYNKVYIRVVHSHI